MAKRLRTEEYESFVESGLSPNADREEADLGSAVERDLQLAQNLEDQLKSGGKSGSKIHREAGSPPRSDEAETIDAQAVNKARKEKLKNDGRKQDQRLRLLGHCARCSPTCHLECLLRHLSDMAAKDP